MNPDVQVERGLPLALEEHDHKLDSSEDVSIIVSPDAMVKYDEKEIHPGLPADPPDGGLRAWSVVIGVMLGACSTFGYVNSWGVLQAYYENNILKDSSASNIAWIGSIQYSLCFMPGLVTGRMFDLGYFRVPWFCASCVIVLCTFLVAECTQYWHFLLCQGIALGLACGVTFGPALSVVSHWFKKRRGIALAMVSTGSSVGGTVFPIAIRRLINEIGFRWAMRTMGFILLVTMAISNLLIRRRLPPVKAEGGLFNPAAFKDKAYTVYCIAGFTTFLGLYTVLTYIAVSATATGISVDFAFYLVSIANASSGFGRIAAGFLADTFGPMNVMVPMTLLAGGLTFAWPFATSEASLVVIAVIYGFGNGAFVALFPAPIITFGEIKDVGRRVGAGMTILSIAALAGPPISGAIYEKTGGFEAVGYYAGSTIFLSALLMLFSRYLHTKSLWGRF